MNHNGQTEMHDKLDEASDANEDHHQEDDADKDHHQEDSAPGERGEEEASDDESLQIRVNSEERAKDPGEYQALYRGGTAGKLRAYVESVGERDLSNIQSKASSDFTRRSDPVYLLRRSTSPSVI